MARSLSTLCNLTTPQRDILDISCRFYPDIVRVSLPYLYGSEGSAPQAEYCAAHGSATDDSIACCFRSWPDTRTCGLSRSLPAGLLALRSRACGSNMWVLFGYWLGMCKYPRPMVCWIFRCKIPTQQTNQKLGIGYFVKYGYKYLILRTRSHSYYIFYRLLPKQNCTLISCSGHVVS